MLATWLDDALREIRGADPVAVVTGITLASDRVLPGDLFVAIDGAREHGATYAPQAIAAGAAAVLTDPAGAELAGELPVPVLVVQAPRAVIGGLAARLYGEPALALTLVAVTGTQGKTTTTRLGEGALLAAGVPAAVIGTVGTRINGEEVASSLTTPEAPDLHALFAVMVERGVRVCMMEVSSHALVMGRVDGVVFDVACFTNLGRDHLDFHADEEAYFAAKASLFTPERARRGLVNADDAHGRRLLAEPLIPMASYALEEPAEWQAIDVVSAPAATTFVVSHGDARYRSTVPLPGSYNVSNALCAVAACGEAGLDPAAVAAGLADSEGVPGRLERVDAGQPYLAVVDYAHKPDAVEAALTAVRPQTRRRLIVVIGAGGDRDAGKRPLMAATAAALADIVVITDDNPRSEDPSAIRAAMRAGIPADTAAQVHEVGDRRAAIRLAVSLAEEGDALVVAGKGHEKGQEIDGTVYPFDDREVLVEEIRAAR